MYRTSLYYGDPINRSNPLMRGLVSRWKVVPWYASGPRFIDIGGSRNHGTLVSGPTWSSAIGRQGGSGSISFNGTSQYISISGAIVSAAPFTVSCWAKVTSTAARQVLFGIADSASAAVNFNLDMEAGGAARAATNDGAGSAATSSTTAAANTWAMYTAVFAAANDRRAFLNGGGKGTEATSRSPTGLNATSIGALMISPVGNYAGGQIDDVCVWNNRALSDSEILALYQSTCKPYDPTLNWIDEDYWLASAAAVGTANFYYATYASRTHASTY